MLIHTSSGWGFPTNDLILQARQKLSRDRIDQVAVLAGLTKKEIARVLGMTERNLYNQHQGPLSVPLSERLLILGKLFEHGITVFDGQQEAFQNWLRTPLAELATPEVGFSGPVTSYQPKPIQQMGTKQGPVSLSTAASTRRHRLAQVPQTSIPTYPTPLSLLDTITGCKLIDNVFTRIEAGVFS